MSIETRKINNKVEIKVTDNGNGIPQKVLDKVFQPFLPPSPPGRNGLGLSLAFDIVDQLTMAELKVETKEEKAAHL
ncbi:MAG: ATP-binding protein [Chitinophagaceae bacterium]